MDRRSPCESFCASDRLSIAERRSRPDRRASDFRLIFFMATPNVWPLNDGAMRSSAARPRIYTPNSGIRPRDWNVRFGSTSNKKTDAASPESLDRWQSRFVVHPFCRFMHRRQTLPLSLQVHEYLADVGINRSVCSLLTVSSVPCADLRWSHDSRDSAALRPVFA